MERDLLAQGVAVTKGGELVPPVTMLADQLRAFVRQVHPTAHVCACAVIQEAAAALERLRAETIEECARVADMQAARLTDDDDCPAICRQVASSIRALSSA